LNGKERIILHVDVNSAYLSFEAVHRLQHGTAVDVREIPSAVAGSQATRHGIILAKSLPAKAYGVKTGEASWEAKRKCPGIVLIPPDYPLYMCCHRALVQLLKDYSDKVQVFSIDECFMEVPGTLAKEESVRFAHRIRERIRQELGFTVSVGVSTNKLLAKMGSELRKPDAVSTLFPPEVEKKMWPLPVEDLYGVGRAAAAKLHRYEIHTIGDLAGTDVKLLGYLFKSYSRDHGQLLWEYAHGVEHSDIMTSGPPAKSIGNSCTVHFDVEDQETAHAVLLSLAETVGMRLRLANLCGRVIGVSIRKSGDLVTYSHQVKIQSSIDCTDAIYEYCRRLFDAAWKGEPIRGLGVWVNDLSSAGYIQLSALEKDWDEKKKVDRTVDAIRAKYGPFSIVRGNFVQSGLTPLTGGTGGDAGFPVMTSIL